MKAKDVANRVVCALFWVAAVPVLLAVKAVRGEAKPRVKEYVEAGL